MINTQNPNSQHYQIPNFLMRKAHLKGDTMFRSLSVRKILYLGLYLSLYLSAIVCLGLVLFVPYKSAQASEDAPNSLWLPLANSDKIDTGDGGNNGGDNPPPPPPPVEEWAFFADMQFRTASADIVTDAQGGKHLAYLYYQAAGDNAPTNAVYLYCAADCDNTANWHGVNLGDIVNEIQLELTPAGQPRVLYRTASESNGQNFFYAECDQSCTDPAQWRVIGITYNRGMSIVEISDDTLPQRYFALNPQGHPAFVYSDRDTWVEPDHLGTFYAFCEQNCSDAANWSEVRISKDNGNQGPYRSEKFYYPSLTFDSTGQPHILADGTSMQDEPFLYYITCETGCGDTASWQSFGLFERGSGVKVSYDIALDGQDRPRVAFFQGAMLEGKGERLVYGWCNSDCTSVANWQGQELGLGYGNGQGPDLELDANGQPRIAYVVYNGGGLGYSSCDSNCESADGHWTHTVVESGNDLQAAWNVAHPPHCDGGIWDGLTPTLSLEQDGDALVAYDATYHARCWYDIENDNWEPFSQFHLVWRAARTVFIPR